LGLVLAVLLPQSKFYGGLIALAAIALGVPYDATIDFFWRGFDQNLWPFGIIIYWVLAPIPMIMGMLLVTGCGRVYRLIRPAN
jgi:hypothetical protein